MGENKSIDKSKIPVKLEDSWQMRIPVAKEKQRVDKQLEIYQ